MPPRKGCKNKRKKKSVTVRAHGRSPRGPNGKNSPKVRTYKRSAPC